MTIEAAPSGPAGLASADPPALRYGVLYADDKGHSHVQYCDLKNFIFKSYAPPAAPQYVAFRRGRWRRSSMRSCPSAMSARGTRRRGRNG